MAGGGGGGAADAIRDKRGQMTESYIGLGSNLDNPARQLRRALTALNDAPGISLARYSSFYRSKPMGPQDQPDFINAVAALKSNLSAQALLARLQAIEDQQGRIRGGQRWGPRTLDLDLLLHGDEVIAEADLTVPHPGLAHRLFVLLPLLELAPEIEIPGQGPAAALLESAGAEGVTKLATHEQTGV